MFDTIKRIMLTVAAISILTIQPAQAGTSLMVLSTMGGTHNIASAVSKPATRSRYETTLEKQCMAFALYHEARGEPRIGQLAVGATIMNRVRSRAYPNTICGVVYQNAHKHNRCQFSFACDTMDDTPVDIKSHKRMKSVGTAVITRAVHLSSADDAAPHDAEMEYTHYHRHDVTPSWSKKLHMLGRIGEHVFFKSERVVRRYNASL